MPIIKIHPGPTPNLDQIKFVRQKLDARGPAWARGYMDRTGGFDRYPYDVQVAVAVAEAQQQVEEQHADGLPAVSGDLEGH